METKASHLFIGSFVLAVVAAGFAFVIWLAKIEVDRQLDFYSIYFDDGVAGLSVGGDVRYNGIPVGTVTSIILDPKDPSRVQVSVEVAADTPVRDGTVASLALQGITGVAYVELTGGGVDAAKLAAPAPGERPVIPSKRSTIQRLAADAPELLNRIMLLVEDVRGMVDEDNRATLSRILKNAEIVSREAAEAAPDLKALIVNLNETSTKVQTAVDSLGPLLDDWRSLAKDAKSSIKQTDEVLNQARLALSAARGGIVKTTEQFEKVVAETNKTLGEARVLMNSSSKLVDRDVVALIGDARKTMKRIDNMAKLLDTTMARNKDAIDIFTSQGLVEFTRFVEEARTLIISANRLIEGLEADPSRILFGDKRGGREVQ